MATMLPFLYQTRTLLRVRSSLLYPCKTLPIYPRLLHTTPARRRWQREDEYIPFERGDGDAENPEDVSKPAQRTSTITEAEQEVFESIFADISVKRRKHVAKREAKSVEKPVPVEGGDRAGASAEAQTRGVVTSAETAPASTERQAASPVSASDSPYATLLRFPASLQAAAREALGLDATSTASSSAPPSSQQQSSPTVVVPQPPLDTTAQQQRAEAAALELRQWREREAAAARERRVQMREQEELREELGQAVQQSMTAARSDFELWDVLERDVFSLVARFGIAEGMVEEGGGQGAGERLADKVPEADVVAAESDAVPDDSARSAPSAAPLELSTYAPLYPSLLLLAARLLGSPGASNSRNNAVLTPSPLVALLLPRIRQLGLASYVLGASTPLFNEVLAARCRVASSPVIASSSSSPNTAAHGPVVEADADAAATVLAAANDCLRLLHELDAAGLRADRRTLGLVARLRADVGRAREEARAWEDGQPGEVGAAHGGAGGSGEALLQMLQEEVAVDYEALRSVETDLAVWEDRISRDVEAWMQEQEQERRAVSAMGVGRGR